MATGEAAEGPNVTGVNFLAVLKTVGLKITHTSKNEIRTSKIGGEVSRLPFSFKFPLDRARRPCIVAEIAQLGER